MPERPNGTVLKTVVRKHPGFESLSLRAARGSPKDAQFAGDDPARSEHVERLVGVLFHVGLAPNRRQHPAIGVDDERGSLVERQHRPLDPELLGDRLVGVRQQGEVERVLVAELGLAVHRVGADTDPLGADRRELPGEVAEVAVLPRATRRHRLRIKEQHDGAVGQRFGQLEAAARVG